jgi:hypothetical protein
MNESAADVTGHIAVEWESAMETKIGCTPQSPWTSIPSLNHGSMEADQGEQTPYRADGYTNISPFSSFNQSDLESNPGEEYIDDNVISPFSSFNESDLE